MKALLPALALAAAALPLLASAADAGRRGAPQPRPRLQPTPADYSVRIDEKVVAIPTASADSVASGNSVALEKMTVRNSRLPIPPRPLDEASRDSFSLSQGGPLQRKTIGPALVEIGLWRWTDILAENAAYQGPPQRVELDFLRIKR